MNSLGIARVIRTKGDPAQQQRPQKTTARAKQPKAVNRMGKRAGRQQVNRPIMPPITINIHNNLPASTSPMRKRKPVVAKATPTRVVASKPVVAKATPQKKVAKKPTAKRVGQKVARTALMPLSLIAKGGSSIAKGVKKKKAKKADKKRTVKKR